MAEMDGHFLESHHRSPKNSQHHTASSQGWIDPMCMVKMDGYIMGSHHHSPMSSQHHSPMLAPSFAVRACIFHLAIFIYLCEKSLI